MSSYRENLKRWKSNRKGCSYTMINLDVDFFKLKRLCGLCDHENRHTKVHVRSGRGRLVEDSILSFFNLWTTFLPKCFMWDWDLRSKPIELSQSLTFSIIIRKIFLYIFGWVYINFCFKSSIKLSNTNLKFDHFYTCIFFLFILWAT